MKNYDRESWNNYLSEKSSKPLKEDDLFNRHQFISADGKWIYHISIIDFLQMWDCSKKTEHFCKTWCLGKDNTKISAIAPNKDALRFLRFVRNYVIANRIDE